MRAWNGATRRAGLRRRCLIACLVFVIGAQPSLAQDAPTSAADLFRQGDYDAAALRWSTAAKAGSAEAMFRLAQMSDLGVGMARDPERALKGYIAAGLRGHTVAQFNAAAMFDIGTDVRRNARRAAFWYSLAAVDGHARSAYDLGLLFARGDGVPQNPELARYWLDRAAPTLKAAARDRARLGSGSPDALRMTPPDILGANVVRNRDGWRVDLAWAAPSGPAGSLFLVELVVGPSQPERVGKTVATQETESSVATFEIGQDPAGLVWRVSRVAGDRSDYAPSPWAVVASDAGRRTDPLTLPVDRVTIRIGGTDAAARRLADELSATLSRSGVWARVEKAGTGPAESAVTYRYGNDRGLATDVASLLPVVDPAGLRRADNPDLAPGEINVTLVGGPATGDPRG